MENTEKGEKNEIEDQFDADIENLTNILVSNNLLENCDISAITILNLAKCTLQNVPLALKDLPLKELNLSHNQLTGIPSCLYMGLEKLEMLNLSHNAIPKFEIEPNCCTTLKTLEIADNLLKNVPQWILNLRAKNLYKFIYDSNKVTYLRCIFDNTSYFPVRKMSMKNCILRQEDCIFFKNCTNLEELDISNSTSTLIMNMFENIDELFIQPSWKNISILKLNNLGLSIFPEGITWLETLTELYFSKNDFIWLPKDGLEFLVNLEVLDLSHNSLYSLPDKLTWLIHLKILKLHHNMIEILPDLSNMKSLETLDLYNNKLPRFECNMEKTHLKHIDLEYNYFDTEDCDLLNYEDMRDQLRQSLKENRHNGCRIDFTIESNESSYASEEIVQGLEYCPSEVSEDWDEEIELHTKQVDVTPSDDEWIGFEETLVYQREKTSMAPNYSTLYNEDVIFCDAD